MGGAASAPELILHHFANSPFPEKVRLVLGDKGPAWMDRMAAIGHGVHSELSSTDAIAMACASAPAPLADSMFQDEDEHAIALGEPVTITAESFGPKPTVGTRVAATRTRYIVARTDGRSGAVHVHFPRIGFSLKKAAAA